MTLANRPARATKGGTNANIVALLSLKLLLLAFFILLSTMSKFEEERSRAVMYSVAVTFAGAVPATEGRRVPDAGIGALDKQASLSDRIRALFQQTLPLVEVETAADGRVLRLEVPAGDLFAMGQSDLRPQRGILLRRLANALTDPRRGPGLYTVEVLHAVPPGDGASDSRLPAARSGTVVRGLAAMGVPADRLSAGLWPTRANPGQVAFEITLPTEQLPPNPLAPATGTGASEAAR
jgi:flagellar motor protein MotB